MSDRAELRKAIMDRLVPVLQRGPAQADDYVDAVLGLFYDIAIKEQRIDVSTLGDVKVRTHHQRYAEARIPLGDGFVTEEPRCRHACDVHPDLEGRQEPDATGEAGQPEPSPRQPATSTERSHDEQDQGSDHEQQAQHAPAIPDREGR